MSIHSLSFYKLNCLIPINKSTKTADFAFRDFLFLHFRRRAASAVTPPRDRNAPRTVPPIFRLRSSASTRQASCLTAQPCFSVRDLPSLQTASCPSIPRTAPVLPPRGAILPSRSPTARRCRASRTAHLVRIALSASDCPCGFRTSPAAAADQKTRRRRNSDLYLRRRAEMLNFIGNRVISHAIPETFSLIRQEL